MNRDIHKEDVEFQAGTGRISGWFFLPATQPSGSVPCIVMAHGYGATKDMGLEPFAQTFARAGMAVLLFDYRGLGASPGAYRQHIDPFRQVDDYRHAITYAGNRPEVEADRIGIWGSSFSGGHVLTVAATDKRVKCAVAQVPTIDGSESFRRRMTPEQADILNKAFAEDRAAQLRGQPPTMRTLVSKNPDDEPVYSNPAAVDWYQGFGHKSANWKNEITMQSMELFRAYKPGCYITDISPCPLMLIVAEDDVVTPADLALEAFEQAGEPKKLVTIPGGHFEPYVRYFQQASQPACEWFQTHL